MSTSKKPYVQFSKRIVVTVVVSVQVFTACALTMLYDMQSSDGLVRVIEYYLIFSALVFVAYCGNSAIEKWALSKVNIAQFELKPSYGSNTLDDVG